MSIKNLWNLLLLVTFFTSFYRVNGQKYNLKHVVVELTNGQMVSGQLERATQNSLVMLDENKLAVGCRVMVKYNYSGVTVFGDIKGINDSELIISTNQAPYERVIYIKQVLEVKVKSYPSTVDIKSLQRTLIGFSEIKQVRIRKRGSVGLGVLIGGAAGAAFAYGIGSLTPDSGNTGMSSGQSSQSNVFGSPLKIEDYGATEAVFGFVLGAPIGGAIGGSKKSFPIGGDNNKFSEFVKRLNLKE